MYNLFCTLQICVQRANTYFTFNYMRIPTMILWKSARKPRSRVSISRWDKKRKKYYTRGGTRNKASKKYTAWPSTVVCGYNVQRKKNSSFRLFLRSLFVQLVSVPPLVPRPSPRSSFVGLSTCADSRIYIQMNCRGRVDLSTYQTWRGEE